MRVQVQVQVPGSITFEEGISPIETEGAQHDVASNGIRFDAFRQVRNDK